MEVVEEPQPPAQPPVPAGRVGDLRERLGRGPAPLVPAEEIEAPPKEVVRMAKEEMQIVLE